jgi:hypothetical protein
MLTAAAVAVAQGIRHAVGAIHFSWGLIALLLVGAFVAAAFAARQYGSSAPGFPYDLTKALFTPAERSFLGVLDQAVGSEHRVFGKVRIADIAIVKSSLSNSARQGSFNRIAAKHFDFIVCRASDLSILCAVELNDKSHAGQRAQSRDSFVANVCLAIKLPLLTISAKQAYSPQELRSQFLAAISPALGS